ncbi:alcohol oxidase [Pholiota conissans]|uniref:pyranose dehydrogenase (acceptor) n=1 Tax=Pholiota conissans TaxID=109636 RepID=A0A9P5YSY5_9AGAR|nr:alcohol oxidase [Pholiota conissans]
MTASIDQVSEKKFDYIIVGGGTAGIALASRLSEDDDTSVLVLEAGPANLNDPLLLTPGIIGVHFNNPQYDWAFQTTPQKEADGRSLFWARGKTLGGSSAINVYQFHRPSKENIDAFERLGNLGWNWDLLKRYYDKSSGFVPPAVKRDEISYDLKQRNADGPVKYSYAMQGSGLEQPYFEALKSMGVPQVDEPFSGDIKGAWMSPVSIDPTTKSRSYSTNMYYGPNAHRKNLTVLVNAHVAKIDLKKENGIATATGVQFVYDGKVHTAFAGKEVILSAGAIMSPQILELSGIGNKKVLNAAGVETIVDLPGVGENVQEHVCSGVTLEIKKEVQDQFTTFDCLRDPGEFEKQGTLLAEGKGVLAMVPTAISFLPLDIISPDAEALQQKLKKTIDEGIKSGRYSPTLQKQFKLQLESIDRGHPHVEVLLAHGFITAPDVPEPGKKYLTLVCLLNHPFSRGSIHIGSKDALQQPVLDPHYFEENYDLRAFIELVKFSRRLAKTEPLNSLLGVEINPGPEKTTDEQIGDYLKQSFSTTFHTAGSCSMLPLQDGGVVDPQLKVYGTSNIRVVDMSIIPLHIGCHPQATVYAISELAADIIKGKVLQDKA